MTVSKAVMEARQRLADAEQKLAEHDAKVEAARAAAAPIEARIKTYTTRASRRPIVVTTTEGPSYVHNGLAGFHLSWYMGEKKERVLVKEILAGSHTVQARLSGTTKDTPAWKVRGASQRARFVTPESQRIIKRAIDRMQRCRRALDEAVEAYTALLAVAYQTGDKIEPVEIATAVARFHTLDQALRPMRYTIDDYRRGWITRDIEVAKERLAAAKQPKTKKEAA